uniref:Uncharacterized protein n=1 Tax=Coccidioides posadasii RMSCC 3488 TaxID=454284 RepID=A0A0J6F859_COCPO|nr:hypothetical protein CPAG_01451 [Coccidioides posadasii RMSCC 3488]
MDIYMDFSGNGGRRRNGDVIDCPVAAVPEVVRRVFISNQEYGHGRIVIRRVDAGFQEGFAAMQAMSTVLPT